MALRDTQDVLIIEQQWTSGTLRVTQDALLIEWQNTNARLRVTQDALLYEYPFINGMFSYQEPGASVITAFTPEFPPIRKQPLRLWGMEAVRADCVAADGQKKSVLDHIDTVTTLYFDFVAASEMAAWKAFQLYALTGGIFGYNPSYGTGFPDPTAFASVKAVSMEWTPKFESFGSFSLVMKLKLVREM